MAMTDDPTDLSERHDPTRSDEPTLSWAEREVLTALRRLARAQAELAAAEAQVAAQGPVFDPADVEHLEQVHAELVAARAKASGRFAKGGARQRVRDLEMAERLVLDRLEMATYEDYRARAAGSRAVTVDPAVADFARRELDSAQAAWHELQSLAEVPDDPSAGAEPEIDLTRTSPPEDPGAA